MKEKINLGIIFPNNSIQKKANAEQYGDLKKNLHSFEVRKYRFDSKGKEKMIKDFKAGNLDVILKNAYGRMHEAEMEKFLDKNKIPYLGSGVKVTLNGTSKLLSKNIFRENNLPVAKDILVNKSMAAKLPEREIKRIETNINYPLLLKDVAGTESKGIFFIENKKELRKALIKISQDDKKYIAEEFIKDNIETTTFVVGDRKPIAYEPVVIIKKNTHISNKDKNKFDVSFQIPAKLPIKTINKIKNISIRAHKALGCKTFSRCDILVKKNKIYLIDIDVHTGLRVASPTLVSARFKGESPNDLFLKFYKLINK